MSFIFELIWVTEERPRSTSVLDNRLTNKFLTRKFFVAFRPRLAKFFSQNFLVKIFESKFFCQKFCDKNVKKSTGRKKFAFAANLRPDRPTQPFSSTVTSYTFLAFRTVLSKGAKKNMFGIFENITKCFPSDGLKGVWKGTREEEEGRGGGKWGKGGKGGKEGRREGNGQQTLRLFLVQTPNVAAEASS